MRLISFGRAGSERPGVLLDEDRILDLDRASGGTIPGIRHLLEYGRAWMRLVSSWVTSGPRSDWLLSAEGVRLGPPVTDPSKIVCLGLNYRCHAEEVRARPRDEPLLFAKAVSSLAGHLDPVWYPEGEDHLDYEAELAVVIGRRCLRADPADWEEYVAGYTIVNDVSGRDAQVADRKWFRGKSYDSTCPMGPWLVTRDEIPDPHDLRITATLNGELRQDGHTRDLLFRIPEILAFASRNITLHPGDVIATGTPAGVGFYRDPPACMAAGDEISVAVEGLGALTNVVRERVDAAPSAYPARITPPRPGEDQ